MNSLKRRATEQLTRNTVAIIEPVQAPATMITLPRSIVSAWRWCTGIFMSIFITAPPPPAYTDLTYGSPNVVAEDHVQSSQIRADGTPTLKRQKTRHPRQQIPARSKSAVDTNRRSGVGMIDFNGIEDQEAQRRHLDAFWSPPELPYTRKPKVIKPQTITKAQDASTENRTGDLPLLRRHSDPAELSQTPISSESSPRNALGQGFVPRASLAGGPPTPESMKQSDSRSPKPSGSFNLENTFKGLELDVENNLPVSNLGSAKRAQRVVDREHAKLEVARQAAKEARLHRKPPRKPLVQSLSPKWEHLIQKAEAANHHQVITKSMEGTELRLKDFGTLLGARAWLNDEIINTYIEWVVDAANKDSATTLESLGEKPGSVPRFIAHNSFFYENLNKKGPQSTERLMKRKKAPGIDLLKVDSVFVPICSGNHWTMGVVRPVAKTIEYFDSMGGRPQVFFSQMRAWLQFQLKDAYHPDKWTEPRTACARQTNGYDCGVFVCTNAFCVAVGLDTSCYMERDMSQQRRNIAAVLLNRGFDEDFAWKENGLLH